MKKQIKELTLLLLYLTSWTEKEPFGDYQRAWKGYDFDILNELGNENMIGKSSHKSKSISITKEGIEKAKELMKKYGIE